MTDGLVEPEAVAQKNWAMAVQTYRNALATYRRYLQLRADRQPVSPTPLGEATRAQTEQTVGLAALEGLTRREREVAKLMARGFSNQQIAQALVLTRGTVANHVAHILAKFGVANRTQVAARLLEQPDAAPGRVPGSRGSAAS